MSRTRTIQILAAALSLIFLATIVTSHEAPKNDRGCHFSEAEGYHCH